MKELEDSGFIINQQKSHLSPVQSLKYLGVIWNTVKGTFSIPLEMQQKALSMNKFLISERDLERLVGLLNFIILDPSKSQGLQRLQSFLKNHSDKNLRDL